MIYLHNSKELENLNISIPDKLITSIMTELVCIEEEYPKCDKKTADKNGPVVILYDCCELDELVKKIPYLKDLIPEAEELVYKDDKVAYLQKIYINTDAGIVLYERRQKWSV